MNTATELRTVSLTVTEEIIWSYAELTDDFNPIHVEADFAAKTSMGRPIAHGTLSLCLVWQCLQRNLGAQALNNLDLQVRFIKPVYIDDVVTAGGHPSETVLGQYEVWVRGQDGSDRIVGTATLDACGDAQHGDIR
jgi:acyl dehydratase